MHGLRTSFFQQFFELNYFFPGQLFAFHKMRQHRLERPAEDTFEETFAGRVHALILAHQWAIQISAALLVKVESPLGNQSVEEGLDSFWMPGAICGGERLDDLTRRA